MGYFVDFRTNSKFNWHRMYCLIVKAKDKLVDALKNKYNILDENIRVIKCVEQN